MVTPQVLKEFKLFRGLGDNELAEVAKLCSERNLTEGSRCFMEGTKATEIHLCRSGKIDIVVQLNEPWNRTVKVHSVKAGEVFGWSALVEPYVYTASGECAEDSQEIFIKGSDLISLFEKNPHVGYVTMRNLSADISARLAQTRRTLSMEVATQEQKA